MPLPNPGMDFVPFDVLTAEEMDDLVENIESLADGTGFDAGAIGASDLASGVALANLDSTATGIPFMEIGRATLGVAGDTISLTGLPARKYLRIVGSMLASGQIVDALRFNNDSGSNYNIRESTNGAADGSAVSQSSISIAGVAGSTNTAWAVNIVNISAQEKIVWGHWFNQNTAGAGNLPNRRDFAGKWANTSAQITRIDVINPGTGDFAIGSQVVVFGKD